MSARHESARAPRGLAGRRLSALVVNYRSGAFARACVDSLRACWSELGGAPRDLEVVVVDNASPEPQEEHLAALEAGGARVLRSRANLGYAGGMNLALAHSRGGPDDLVAFLNPDLWFPSGSLGELLAALDVRPDAGLAGPAVFLDPECCLHHPRPVMPTPRDLVHAVTADVSVTAARSYAARRSRLARAHWSAREVVDVELLSGACLFARRGALAALDTVFDTRYPLYFEDTDLCRRLRALGRALLFVPRARVVHHWARSSGAGGEQDPEALARYSVSRRAYLERFHGASARALIDQAEAAAAQLPPERRHRPIHPLQELGACSEPPALRFARSAEFAIEVGMAPTWLLAAGVLGRGDGWTCPPSAWEWFFQGRYFVRALERESGALLGAWTFEKTTPARREPLAAASNAPRGLH